MQINSCTLELSLFYYDLRYKKKELIYTVHHCFWDQHNCKLSSELLILTLTQCKLPINSKYIL